MLIYTNYNLENKKIIITHQPRTDRSGSFLLVDLFFYVFSKRWNYDFKIDMDFKNKKSQLSNPKILYDFFGWNNLIGFINNKEKFINISENEFTNKNRENNYIITNDTKIFENIMIKLDDFDNYFNKNLRKKLFYSFKKNNINYPIYFNKSSTNISIHIRRGDVDTRYYKHAYFPNNIFVKLIRLFSEKYKNANINVFSCERNVEGWNDFKNLNCKLHLRKNWSNDGLKFEKIDIQHFIESDILVIGGTFSYLPGFLNQNIVYYPEMYWHSPLKHWISYDINGNIKKN